MFNPFVWLDSILLGAAQKFCDKVQWLTGLTKFTFQKWALIATTTCFWGVYFFSQRSVLIVLLLIFTSSVIYIVHLVEKAEAEFLKNGNLTFSSHDSFWGRFPWVSVYGYFVFLSSLSTENSDKMMFYGNISFILWVYFSACIPRPPSKSRMRELYEKVLWKLYDWSKPEPVPTTN